MALNVRYRCIFLARETRHRNWEGMNEAAATQGGMIRATRFVAWFVIRRFPRLVSLRSHVDLR